MLVYVWNDYVDFDYDQRNQRKDSYLFGAKAKKQQLVKMLRWTFWIQVPCAIVLTVADNFGPNPGGIRVLLWFVVCVGVNGLYNHPIPRFSERPPLDLLLPAGYLGVAVLSSWLNRTDHQQSVPISAEFWVYNLFLVLQTQIWAQMVDVNVDQAAGRRTSAVRLGVRGTQILLTIVVLFEVAWVWKTFDDVSCCVS
jgi:4-hydroxybenzoate polyprenyltransferase